MKRIDNKIYEVLKSKEIANTPELISDTIQKWGNNNKNVREHHESYFHKIKKEGSCGPIEKHPYIEKYVEDFDLSRKILLLGTFPPNSYMNNLELSNLPNPNVQSHKPIDFFYGNMPALWYYLFGLNNEQITVENIREKLSDLKMSITDVFAFVQRSIMKDGDDNQYVNIVLNSKVMDVFKESSKIDTIITTSGGLINLLTVHRKRSPPSTLNGFYWIIKTHFDTLSKIQISGQIDGKGDYFSFDKLGIENAVKQQNAGIIWWLKYGNKRIKVANLPSPSGARSRSIPRSIFYKKWVNFVAEKNGIPLPNMEELKKLREQYFPKHSKVFSSTPTNQYRKDVYSKVLNNTIHEIKL